MRVIFCAAAAMVFAVPAFAQSKQIVTSPSSSEEGIELQIAQTSSLNVILAGSNVSQHGVFSIAQLQLVCNGPIFSIGAGTLQSREDTPVAPSAEGVFVPRLYFVPRAPRGDGKGLTPDEVQEFQTQLQCDTEAALAKLAT